MLCWLHFGCQNPPKSGQDRSKMALEAVFFDKRGFSRNIGRRNVWGISRAPRRHPKRHKIAPRRLQDSLISVLFSLRFLHRFFVAFWCDFGAILGCFGVALGGPNRSFLASIFACESKSACACARWVCEAVWMRLGSGSEQPRRAQERPKSGQERPKRGLGPLLGRSWPLLGRSSGAFGCSVVALGSLFGA